MVLLLPIITGGLPFDTGTPYQVSWVGPNGFSLTEVSISNLEAGLYTITIEDKNGLTTSENFTITQPDILEISKDLEKNVSCFNGNDGSIEVTINGVQCLILIIVQSQMEVEL
tara:strand:- start:2965 stop:3303 length:339 start_codon:yes stop_codon:yes gene_type:complete